MKLLLMTIFFMTSLTAFTQDDVEFGVTVLANKSDIDGEAGEVTGVAFMLYDGKEVELNSETSIHLVPTEVYVSVDGESKQVYTNLSTLKYYGLDNLSFAVSALSIKSEDQYNFSVRKDESLSYLDLSAIQFIPVGSFELDLSAGLSIGGKGKYQDLVNGVPLKVESSQYHAFDLSTGFSAEVGNYNLYIYAGAERSKGDKFEAKEKYIGVELFKDQNDRFAINPYFKISDIERNYIIENFDQANPAVEDTLIEAGVRIYLNP